MEKKKKKIWHRPKVTELDMMAHTLGGTKEANKEGVGNTKNKTRS